MKSDRWSILLESFNRSLLSYQLYASSRYQKRKNDKLFDEYINVKIPKIIKERIEEYCTKEYIAKPGTVFKHIFEGNDVLKSISVCFDLELNFAKRILQGYNCFKDNGLIIRFTNIEDDCLNKNENISDFKNLSDCYFPDAEFIYKINDFILQDQIAILDTIKYMYDNVTFEKDNNNFGTALKEICFDKLWNGENGFNILDMLWKWYIKTVDKKFVEFEDEVLNYIFGNPLVQCYNRMLLESNLLHAILVILQAYKSYLHFENTNDKIININSINDSSVHKLSLINKCRVIISKLQSKCFLGSLFTLYSSESGIKIGTLSSCDNSLAHSPTLIDQLRQTSTNGILLACSLILSLSPKSIINENEDLGFIISIIVTILESLSTNESGEILKHIGDDELSFITPSRSKSLNLELQRQRIVRGNLLLAHAKVVKPILPALVFSYASIVVQTPNREALILPVINTTSFFESSAFTDSLENILLALNTQNPIKQPISVKLDFEETLDDIENKEILLGESFGTYYQHLIVYDLIRNTISTFSLNALSFVARITKHLSSLLRKEPRLVFRECWRGDYFRQIGVHLILEMYTLFFPYGIVEFLDLLSSLLPDYTTISNFSKSDYDMSKQAFKLFMAFIKNPIKYINFPPYLNSLGITPVPINYWDPETMKKNAEIFELPLHVEVSKIETSNFKAGSSFSQSSLLGTLEGCILDFLNIQLTDITPLSSGFPNSRRCLTPLRTLPIGIAQTVPLKSLLLQNAETSFSSPLWSTSPYGLTYDFPESEMPPYYHINNSKKSNIDKNIIDINLIRLPSNLPKNSNEIKIGNLDPYTIQFNNNNSTNSNFNSMPSLLRIILFLWDSISLSFSQLNGNFVNKQQVEMLASLTEIIYKLTSFHQSIIFVLEKELSSWNALVPNNYQNFSSNSQSSPQFGIIAIKTLQTLKGIDFLLSNKNNDEEIFKSVFYMLPRLIQIIIFTLKPIDLFCIEDALNYNFLRLHSNANIQKEEKVSEELHSQTPWNHRKDHFPIYWLIPLLLSSTGFSQVNPNLQKDFGSYSCLLKGISGFTVNEFFNLITKTIEFIEKQFRSYPITAQGLQFIENLLLFCPVSFWGLGWDRHARLLLNIKLNSINNSVTSKLFRDLQLLLNDCILFQMCSIEEQNDLFNFFNKISNFTVHSVLSRIPSWQFNIDSERNLLFLRSLNVFRLLINSMDSITLIDDEYNLNGGKDVNSVEKSNFTDLKDIIPNISNIASSNHHSLIATILKHLTETGLIPTLLNILFCEYSIYSRSLRKSKYSFRNQDELEETIVPWQLLISNSLIAQSMVKNKSLSYKLAIHFQHTNSQIIFIDRYLTPPFECYYKVPNKSGIILSMCDVIISQQIVTKVLEVILKLFNSTSDVQSNSVLLKSLRSTLVQWILTSSNNLQVNQISSNILDAPKFAWSDTDLIAQNIHSKLSTVYNFKKPLMNFIKSLLAFITSFIPSSLPYKASLFATKLFSSFCYILSIDPDLNKNSRLDLVLEQILKPPVSLNSVQQDFLLCLANTKLFSKLIKLLHQELDFILIAPIFNFFKIMTNNSELRKYEKQSFEMTKAILELLNLISTSHPSILLYSTGSFEYENANQIIENCKIYFKVYSGSIKNTNSKTSNSRIKLICLIIFQIIEKSNYMLKYSNEGDVFIYKKLEYIISLVPHCINLLMQLLEDNRSRDVVIQEMFNSNNKFNTSLWKILISITQNIVLLLKKFKLKDLIDDNLFLITLLVSSITCIYHLTSRFINITTYSSFQDSDKLPMFLRDTQMFEFIKFLISNESIHDILHSSHISNQILAMFTKSNNHFKLLDDKLGIPMKYCIFYNSSINQEDYELVNFCQNSDNSLEQFVNKYYYERYLKFSHLIISNESIHTLTEFNVSKIIKFQDKISSDNNSSSFDANNQSIKTISINNSETSQLASLEMVWESGQLLAPKQHISPKSIAFDRKDNFENAIEDSNKSINSDSILKHSVINSRVEEYSDIRSKTTESFKGSGRNSYSPNLHTIRNSSFIYKTKRWGTDFEIDISALLILLSCSTMAGLSIPHTQMNLQELFQFSEEILNLTKKDNLSRSFIESFMYLLTSYNELLFYLKSILPIITVRYRKLITKSQLIDMATLFDSTKINLLSHCINLIQEENLNTQNSEFSNKKLLPNLLMTILFSTCLDLVSFDLFSSVKLILGRIEMMETKNIVKDTKKKTKLDQNKEILLDVISISPSSSSVSLSSSWQSDHFSKKNGLITEDENQNFDHTIGNLVNFLPTSAYSEKSQINNLRRLSPLIIENCCKYVINNLKNILPTNDNNDFISTANSNSKKYTSRIPNNAFKNLWTIKSFKNLKISNVDYISEEHEVYLSCDIISSIYLLLFMLKQTSNLFDPDENETSIKNSTMNLLLQLASSSLQFYNKNIKTIQRIANDPNNSETSSKILSFFASSLISIPIMCINIPTYIMEVFYSENKKKLLNDFPSEFAINSNISKVPIINKIKELLVSNHMLKEFNLEILVKILPLLNSIIQLNSTNNEKNEYFMLSHQYLNKKENLINSFDLLKPLKIPFLSWNEASHFSLLNSIVACLTSISSTPEGCVFILKSGILIQMVSKIFLLNNWNFKDSSNSDQNSNSATNKNFKKLNSDDKDQNSLINSFLWPFTYSAIGHVNSTTIRNPMHIIWCRIISLATNIFSSISKFPNRSLLEDEINSLKTEDKIGGSEYRYVKFADVSIEKGIFSQNLTTISRKFPKSSNEFNKSVVEKKDIFLRDDPQIKEFVYKFIQLTNNRIQFTLTETRFVSQLAMLEEFNLCIDLIRSILSLEFNEIDSNLIDILRKALRTIRNISVVSLGRGITESFDLFKPISMLEKISAGHNLETLNIYHLDNLPAQVPSIFHQRCCILLLNSIRSIIDAFISDSNFSIELFGSRELLMQLFHDTMDLGRPIIQLLEDIPNHCYSVFTIIKTRKGDSFLPLSLNIQALHPNQPIDSRFIQDTRISSINKNLVEFKGISKLSALTESCCLPEMITFDSFIQLLSSLIDIISICGIKCLYTLESLESTEQHNDTLRRFLEFLHLSQGLNTSTLLESSRKLVEKVYANLKSKLGDQINVEVVGLVGIKKDPIHAILFDRLSNTNSSINSGI